MRSHGPGEHSERGGFFSFKKQQSEKRPKKQARGKSKRQCSAQIQTKSACSPAPTCDDAGRQLAYNQSPRWPTLVSVSTCPASTWPSLVSAATARVGAGGARTGGARGRWNSALCAASSSLQYRVMAGASDSGGGHAPGSFGVLATRAARKYATGAKALAACVTVSEPSRVSLARKRGPSSVADSYSPPSPHTCTSKRSLSVCNVSRIMASVCPRCRAFRPIAATCARP
jgi:hypothetical protein